MISLLKGIEGEITTVELRNERIAKGCIEDVDEYMNVTMSDVTFTDVFGESSEFETFYIHGKNVRYIQIPDHKEIGETIQETLGNYGKARKHVDKRVKKKILSKDEKKQKLKNTMDAKKLELLEKLKKL